MTDYRRDETELMIRLRNNRTIGRRVMGHVQVDTLQLLHLDTPTEQTRVHLQGRLDRRGWRARLLSTQSLDRWSR